MAHTEETTGPVYKNGFSYEPGVFSIEVDGSYYRRYSKKEIKQHVSSIRVGTDKRPCAWYKAQLKHYGIQTLTKKHKVISMLQEASKKGELEIPIYMKEMEQELKRQWEKNDKARKSRLEKEDEYDSEDVPIIRRRVKNTRGPAIQKGSTSAETASTRPLSTPASQKAVKASTSTKTKPTNSPKGSSFAKLPKAAAKPANSTFAQRIKESLAIPAEISPEKLTSKRGGCLIAPRGFDIASKKCQVSSAAAQTPATTKAHTNASRPPANGSSRHDSRLHGASVPPTPPLEAIPTSSNGPGKSTGSKTIAGASSGSKSTGRKETEETLQQHLFPEAFPRGHKRARERSQSPPKSQYPKHTSKSTPHQSGVHAKTPRRAAAKPASTGTPVPQNGGSVSSREDPRKPQSEPKRKADTHRNGCQDTQLRPSTVQVPQNDIPLQVRRQVGIVGGCYNIETTSELECGESVLRCILDGTTLLAKFRLAHVEGVLWLPNRPSQVDGQTHQFQWRGEVVLGRKTGRVYLRQCGGMVFDGNGVIHGFLEGKSEHLRFNGLRVADVSMEQLNLEMWKKEFKGYRESHKKTHPEGTALILD